jgi:hypothetical protein
VVEPDDFEYALFAQEGGLGESASGLW